MKYIYVALLLFIGGMAQAQNDTIKVKNGNVIYGEIKKIRSRILTIETPYSDDDFTIDFDEVTEIKVQKVCFIVLTYGRRKTGYVQNDAPGKFAFTDENGGTEIFDIDELIMLDTISDSFWHRINGNIDFGYNLTKANNASQISLAGGIGYRGPTWVSNLSISSLNSQQDNTLDIERTDITASLQRILPRKWYLIGNLSFLSNTEQALNSRYAIRPGAGRFLVLSNKLSWGLNAGLNFNLESFSDETPDRNSTELYLGSQLHMFDYKDFKLITDINIFPSLSEKGRWRVDYSLDVKYDLPYDFYIKSTIQFNYDNQSALAGSDFDYIFTTGFGWKFD